jgi:hypothetical protein
MSLLQMTAGSDFSPQKSSFANPKPQESPRSIGGGIGIPRLGLAAATVAENRSYL